MRTALLVIDVQESFRAHAGWSRISDPTIGSTVGAVVDRAREVGDEVVWVLHQEPGTGTVFDPELGHVRPLAELEPTAAELVVHKTSHNAFTTTNLAQHLTARGVGRVRIVGIRTEQCCETTARLASDLGYQVDFVVDATATHPLALADGSGELTAEQVVDRTAAALSGRFARIVTVDQIMSTEPVPVAG